MVCIIVILHAGAGTAKAGAVDMQYSGYVTSSVGLFAKLAMNYFFAISGFLFFFNLNNFRRKISKRFMTLVVPYFLWELLTVSYKYVRGTDWDSQFLFDKVLLFGKWPPNGPLWYLEAVFLLMLLLTPLLKIVFKRWWGGAIASIAIMWAVSAIGFSKNGVLLSFRNYGLVGSTLQYLPAYVIGSWCGWQEGESEARSHLDIFAFLIIFAGMIFDAAYKGFLMSTMFWIAPMGIIYFMPAVGFVLNFRLSQISFMVYAMHQPLLGEVLSGFRKIIQTWYPSAVFSNVVGRVWGLTVSLLAAWSLWYVLKRWAPRTLQALTGGRM